MERRVSVLRMAGFMAAGILACAHSQQASADVVLSFGNVFSGSVPAGNGPWLTASFSDTSLGLRLEITAGGLSGDESIAGVYFNLDPALNPSTLVLTRDAASTGPTAANTSIGLGANAYRADGDGYYDILFDLPPPPGSQAARFTAGESLIYWITGSQGISAASFAFLSAPGPGNGPGPQYAAAHILQIAGGGSGWVGASAPSAVPIPAALALFAPALALLRLVPRRRRIVSAERAGSR